MQQLLIIRSWTNPFHNKVPEIQSKIFNLTENGNRITFGEARLARDGKCSELEDFGTPWCLYDMPNTILNCY